MYRIFFSLRALASFFLVILTSSLLLANDSAIKDLINQEVIRIYVFDGNGMGHQSNSFLLGRWLRQQGFKGELQFVFKDFENRRISTRELPNSQKVHRLYPAYNPEGSDEQFIETDNVRVIKLPNDSTPESLPKVKYLLSGGVDKIANHEDFLDQVGLNDFFDIFIVVNPWRWHSLAYFHLSDSGKTFEIDRDNRDSYFQNSFGLPIEIPTYEYPSMASGDYPIKEILDTWAQNDYQVWPFYGNFYDAFQALNNLNHSYERSIAQQYSWDPPSPTVIIPIFLPVADKDDFMQDFNDEMREKFRSPEDIQENEINFVLVDSVSPAEFERIFLSENFPLVIASGQNSVNLLASRGQNFLQNQQRISSDPYEEFSEANDPLAKLRKDATRLLNAPRGVTPRGVSSAALDKYLRFVREKPQELREWSRGRSAEFRGDGGAFEYTFKGLIPHLQSVNSCSVYFQFNLSLGMK